ncbi:hypothetical protein [Couchioplanes caeruleus]|uniref:PE domain-containing protein n=2 Tax=Couchioplanes caeruleus TaxID=56438 RepID=A0A1K0GF74_9ACTN|nr:hypothetical protein [Couchioplanes caeruleus]OJF09492.1 hypothetical protein BG844_37430 [Couchioplanes caeruleus subsp. caeruleus]ROP31932.1 hypothetical protein EDD30_4859 [Couchioplanes caeruleus]
MHELPDSSITSFASIETDIHAMEEFARTLANEVQAGYDPNLQRVTTAMMTELPAAGPAFPELQSFLTVHNEVQNQTFANTFNFRDGTHIFATAARSISAEYRNSDAYAHANVADVEKAFSDAVPAPGDTETL